MLSAARIRVSSVDWAVVLLLACLVSSKLFSEYLANNVHSLEALGLAGVVYFAVRLFINTPVRAASFAALVGLCGTWMASLGFQQFVAATQQLTSAGLTDFIAFRLRFMQVISGWVTGEILSLFLLALPFICAAGIYVFWRGRNSNSWSGFPSLGLLPALPIIAGGWPTSDPPK